MASSEQGKLTSVKPIITLGVTTGQVNPTTGQPVVNDTGYQLQDIKVLAPNSAEVGGSKPAQINGSNVSAPWDPIRFSVAATPTSGGLTDIDPSRPGVQVQVTIDISRSGMTVNDFNAYLKYVSAEAISAASGSGGLRDLDGVAIRTAGWYDFTQRQNASGQYVGDGARYIVEGNAIKAIVLTITDNAFGDNDSTRGRVFDPGLPVWYVPRITPPPALDQVRLPDLSPRGLAQFDRPDFNRTPLRFDSALLGVHGPSTLDGIDSPESLFANAPRETAQADWSKLIDVTAKPTAWRPTTIPSGESRLAVLHGMADQWVDLSESGHVTVPGDAFLHTRADANVTLTATLADGSALPDGVVFDPRTGTFTVADSADLRGELSIRLTARDGAGHEASTLFRLKGAERLVWETVQASTGRSGLSEQIQASALSRRALASVSPVH